VLMKSGGYRPAAEAEPVEVHTTQHVQLLVRLLQTPHLPSCQSDAAPVVKAPASALGRRGYFSAVPGSPLMDSW
jgi:hypothetical protein